MRLITVDPDVLHGQAHVRGTRIPVSLVLGCLAEGLTVGIGARYREIVE